MTTTICIYLIASAVIAITSYILGYTKGKHSKEIEVIKNNNNLKRKYANNRKYNKKDYINNSNSLSNKLQNNKY